MNLDKAFSYKFQTYEPGVLIELYLPKKAKYQGKLYEVLTDGFRLKNVKENLKRKKKERSDFLKNYTEIEELTDCRIDKIASFYYGYSMYEVDGVFFSPQKGSIEERTQIIRLMFFPNLEEVQTLEPKIEYKKLRSLVHKLLKGDAKDRETLGQLNQAVAEYIKKWIDDIALFLFGYILFELCEQIKQLNEYEGQSIEEEIWLTSFWNLRVNRVKVTIAADSNGLG